jgi:tyrosinase
MSEVPVAAFDPIFTMCTFYCCIRARSDILHSNMDRLFAIWQTLNLTVWFTDKNQQLSDEERNWSTLPNTINTPSTPLAPFHTDTNGMLYTPDAIRDWTKLGYSYTELQLIAAVGSRG